MLPCHGCSFHCCHRRGCWCWWAMGDGRRRGARGGGWWGKVVGVEGMLLAGLGVGVVSTVSASTGAVGVDVGGRWVMGDGVVGAAVGGVVMWPHCCAPGAVFTAAAATAVGVGIGGRWATG